MKTSVRLSLSLALFCSILLSGCAANISRSAASMPISKFLAPVRDSSSASQKVPLKMPASVAIVLVPGSMPETSLRQAAEKLKQQLTENPKYIKSAEIVSADDVGNPLSLERIQALYATDIAILISYQQNQRSKQSGPAGLLDATIVGAFVVPGVQIKTATLIDGKVIHIPSNAIIFRASGKDERSTLSTSYATRGNAGEDSVESLLAASTDFGNTLTKVLSKFDSYDLSHAVALSTLAAENGAGSNKGSPSNDYWQSVDNYKSGGGALDGIGLALAALVCGIALRRK